MRTIGLALTCCAAICAAAVWPGPAQTRESPTVEVSQSATSLPGPTYAWVPMPARLPAESDPRVQDPQLRARLQASLDKALQAKGYRRIDDVRKANIAVAYRVGVQDVQQTSVRESGGGLQSAPETAMECHAGGCSQIVTQGENGVPTVKVSAVDIIEGGLMVEVIQPSDIRVLWRALYRGSVRAKDARSINLDAIAKRTLEQLPRAGAK
jgi:hypothetical protein